MLRLIVGVSDFVTFLSTGVTVVNTQECLYGSLHPLAHFLCIDDVIPIAVDVLEGLWGKLLRNFRR